VAEFKIENSELVIFGIKRNIGGSLNIAGQTELYSKQTGETLGKTSTDKFGYWEFRFPQDSILSGRYEIRFYGSGTKQDYFPEGDWEVLDVVASDTEALMLTVLPSLTVTEDDAQIDVNKAEWAVGIAALTNVNVTSGKLLQLEVHYKLSTDVNFEFLTTLPIVVSGNSVSVNFRFPLKFKEVDYDFFFILKNGAGIVGRTVDTGLDAEITESAVTFNGVADLKETYSVPSVTAKNVSGGKLIDRNAKLEWTELRTMTAEQFPYNVYSGYNNAVTPLSYAQSRKVLNYVVYMYVSDDGTPPPVESPATNVYANNLWYYVGEFSTNTAEIRCPDSKFVAFWVGFRMTTTSQIPKRELSF
jgi:hypothetical protein